MTEYSVFTYQTRLTVTAAQSLALSETANKFGQAQRTLFTHIASGDDALKIKKSLWLIWV